MMYPPLVDGLGRVHRSLRVSVTDRCNIRCVYCMPAEAVVFRPREELLTFEEMRDFCHVCISLGVNQIRLTGGEPLLRADLPRLVAMLAGLDGLEDLALTTNGMLLRDVAGPLREAGLQRLNISLDTLSESMFLRISRRTGLERVLDGIAAAMQAGFPQIRLNAISLRHFTETEVVPLARFARARGLELRFIEFMPLDADQHWNTSEVLSGREVRTLLEHEFGPLRPATRDDLHQPATDYVYADGRGSVGFINSVTEPFCADCDRLRLTAEGQVRNCLFSTVEWDARQLLRMGASDDDLRDLL
ncbi:MAG TPA: GTP 3',8-cyclase MoaA, partial [Pirellulaceae bacterium]